MQFATPAAGLFLALFLPGCLNTGHSVNAYVGGRNLENQDFEALATEEQTVYGFDGVLALSQEWFAVEVGYLHSDEDDMGNEVDIDEYFVGLRFTPWKILVQPYASIGATFIDTNIDAGGMSEDDTSPAGYVRVGAAITLGFLRLGLDARWVAGSDFDFSDVPLPNTDLDYYQLMAFAGLAL